MGDLLVKEKSVVVPGDILADGMDYLPGFNVFREGEKLIAKRLGLVNLSGRLVKILPLSGIYMPRRGDIIIGKVVSIGLSGWRVDFGWPYEANLSLKDASSDYIERTDDLTKYYDVNDYVVAQITNVSGSKIMDLTMKGPGLRKLSAGRLIYISPSKVPRVIGKGGSMINLIKDLTDSRISVGQNGIVWLVGTDAQKELIAVEAIQKIEDESHLSGLTDRVKEYIEGRLKK